VSRIDPRTRAVVDTIPVGATPSGIAVGAGDVWVVDNDNDEVSRIDPSVDQVVQTIPVGNAPTGVAVGDGSVWVANDSDQTLMRINAVTRAVTATIPLGSAASGVAAGLGAVWVSDPVDGRVLEVDPGTDQVVQSIAVGGGADAIVTGLGSVWVANSLDGTVSRIDPASGSVIATIAVGAGPASIAIEPGAVWVANQFAGTVVKIDTASDAVVRTITVGNRPDGLAAAGDLLWLGSEPQAAAHRGGTLRYLYQSFPGPADPGANAFGGELLLPYAYDGLTDYERTGSQLSARVVPDLAMSLPTPTDGGTTYTFQLRHGIRYSDGQPVRPEDFRVALERDFVLGQWVSFGVLPPVIGAAGRAAHPKRCDLSRGVVANDTTDTVTFHLVAPDPELMQQLALPDEVAVPANTPLRDLGDHPIPATGPYEFSVYNEHEIKLVRNPYFHVWSQAARPDGYPNQIVVRLGATPEQELTEVERDDADFSFGVVPANRFSQVQTRYASQVYVNPIDATNVLVLNTRVAPFNKIDVRPRDQLRDQPSRARTPVRQ
jgi:YVTN family beta-propeller protein